MTRAAVVIGAGLAGLACARALAEHGCAVTVIDKGRRPGGRTCSRRDPTGRRFDHGAQYFTARGAWLRDQVAAWAHAGVIARWSPRVQRGTAPPVVPTEPWWVGTPDMGALGRHLARGLDVRSGRTVTAVARVGRSWVVRFEGAEGPEPSVHADLLVLAVPAVPCARLLAPVSALAAAAAAVVQTPCWAAMLGLRGDPSVDVDAFEARDGVIAWAAREGSKPGRPGPDPDRVQAWTVHASTAWSTAHLEAPADQVRDALAAELVTCFPRDTVTVVHAQAHRWRYARGQAPSVTTGAWFDPTLELAVCGDWLAGARVEGALTSGLAAAAGILDRGAAATAPTQAPAIEP